MSPSSLTSLYGKCRHSGRLCYSRQGMKHGCTQLETNMHLEVETLQQRNLYTYSRANVCAILGTIYASSIMLSNDLLPSLLEHLADREDIEKSSKCASAYTQRLLFLSCMVKLQAYIHTVIYTSSTWCIQGSFNEATNHHKLLNVAWS